MAMMAMMMFICVVIALIHGSISAIKDDCNDVEGGGSAHPRAYPYL